MICGLFYSNNSTAQQEVLDGIYVKEHHPAKRVIPYTPLREADVMWLKRIWRVLDLREKINHPLYYPTCLLYTSPSPRDRQKSRMPSSA